MNTLYYGDNLEILRDEKRMPSESVDLCYIDPPFNSQQNYNQIYSTVRRKDAAQAQAFTDMWIWDTPAEVGYREITGNEGGRFQAETIELFRGLRSVLKESSLLAYLVSITLRLVEIHRALRPTGSFYLHCDPTASHYLKLVLDSLFGQENFLSEIVWKRTSSHSAAKRWADVHDVLLFFAKTKAYRWNEVLLPHSEEYTSRYKHEDEDGRVWTGDNMTAPGVRNGDSGAVWRGYDVTARGLHWKVNLRTVEGIIGPEQAKELSTTQKLDLLDDHGFILWPRKSAELGGGFPRFKRYLSGGSKLQDVITDIPPINSQAQERLGYPTQKPEALMDRIIRASSSEGDIVMDVYCGCGTTVAVAQKLNRQWIGMDITYQSIALILKRLEDSFGSKILTTIRVDGIPHDYEAAEALALRKDDRTRKEFEKWAVLTYSHNRAVIHQKKGADRGIDGVAYFATGRNETDKMVFQVKSGDVKRSDIATLKGDMDREGAALATLITLREPTKPMRDEAAHSGVYFHALTGRSMNRIQIVTIRDILEHGKRLDLPLTTEVLKQAPKHTEKRQLGLLD